MARAKTASGDEILLRKRGEIWEIRYNGIDLMSNLNYQSELQLALRAMRRMEYRARRILIGGLGMGYTLRAVLNMAPPDAEVTVCELIPEIAAWNRGPLSHLADHPLRDPRVRLVLGDVQAEIARSMGAYDLILLDTDNGPDFLVRAGNAGIYAGSGIDAVAKALRPEGLAAFWSAAVSPAFEAVLDRSPWSWTREDIPLVAGRVDAMHHIYSCSLDLEILGLKAAA